MYKDDSFHSTKFSTDRGYATSLDMNIYLWKEDIEAAQRWKRLCKEAKAIARVPCMNLGNSFSI